MIMTPGHVSVPPAAVHHAAPEPAPALADQTYTVQAGDSLWSIAQRFYGNPFKWPDIYHANQSQIADPSVISIGQALTATGPAPRPRRPATGPAPRPRRAATGPAPRPRRAATGPAPRPRRAAVSTITRSARG